MRSGRRPLPLAACARSIVLAGVAVVLLAMAVAAPKASPASASFPGANGKIIYLNQLDLMVVEPDGSGATKIGGNYDQAATWSPDGQKIAFQALADGVAAIFTMNPDGTGRTQLTSSQLPDINPTWSPDGSKIAFESGRTGVLGIYVMNADGTDQHRISSPLHHSMSPSWSPDGSRIAFLSTENGSETIAMMDPDGSNVVDITQVGTWSRVDWSPDGTKLALSFPVEGRNQVHTMDPDGTDLKRLVSETSDTWPFWSPDGTMLAFSQLLPGQGMQPQIVTTPAGGDGTQRTAITPAGPEATGLSWQPISPATGNPTSSTTTTVAATTTAAPTSSAAKALTPRYTG